MSQTKIVECVPNFSEGRDLGKIKKITDAIEAVSGVQLLNVEPGQDTHRTVVTFVGTPEAVEEAAFQAIKLASTLIDMRTHKGAHPRMGATDVCPFIPVSNVTMDECVAIAKRVGNRVGQELSIPVYLYESAATSPNRKNLAEIRKGEYEGFFKKISEPEWKPDFGPSTFNEISGGTVIGAREFLIAYNINLNTTSKQYATEVAFELRNRGRIARVGNTKPFYYRGKKMVYEEGALPCGSCNYIAKTWNEIEGHCKNEHGYNLAELLRLNDIEAPQVIGKNVYRPGKFDETKAIGWYVDDYHTAQISINLTNYKVTSLHQVFDEACEIAAERGLRVTGSEIVGVVPFQALLESGLYYLKKQGRTTGLPLSDILRCAVQSLGLSDVAPFDVEKKVLGLPKANPKALIKMTVSDFSDEVSRDTPAPGGGSISALSGALGAALVSMVATLTHGKEGSEDRDSELARIAESAQQVRAKLMIAVDEDTNAFNSYMEALRLPKNTPEEKALRSLRMQEGLKQAIQVPWEAALACHEALKLAGEILKIGNPNSLTDGAVGAQMAFAGVRGTLWNVIINLKGISDKSYVEDMLAKSKKLLEAAQADLQSTSKYADEKLMERLRPNT